LRASGARGGSFYLSTNAGRTEFLVSGEKIRLDPSRGGGPADALDEGAFAHLLFRGFGGGGERIRAGKDRSLLRALFAEQDFVIWQVDAF
jgi:hypothetical protein